MKFLKNFFRTKSDIIDCISIELKILQEEIDLFLKINNHSELRNFTDQFLSYESEFSNNFDKLLKNINIFFKRPYYWNEIFDIITELKKISALFNSYYYKSIAFENKNINCSLFANQKYLFNNLQNFLKIFLSNRDYASELIKNNEHEINSFSDKYISILNNEILQSEDSLKQIEVFRVFEKLNERNEKVQNAMMKLFVVTNL